MTTIVRRSSKPRTYACKDVYKAYAAQLVKENPGYWGKYNKRMPNYSVYKQEGQKVIEVISYPRFKRIIETWFQQAQSYIIAGEILTLGHNLGKIGARRVERNFKNKQVDWKKTMDMWQKKNKREGLMYHLGEDWIRIGWKKPGKIKNEHFYRFTPANGNSSTDVGFKKLFSMANQTDPTLKFRYQYFPYLKETTD